MRKNERKLIVLAGVLFAAVLVVRVVPLVLDWYAEGEQEIARLENRLDGYRELIANTGRWMERERTLTEEVARLGEWVFEAANPNLVVTSVQSKLRTVATRAGVSVRETARPEYQESGEWLVVSQEISFNLSNQAEIVKFLDLLEDSRPHLFVTEFSITQSRRQYAGSLVVTGFGKLQARDLTASAPL